MLKPHNRLVTPLGHRATRITTPQFILKYRKNSLLQSRFCFVISKRVAKSAVLRNRIKRLFRSHIEKNLEKIPKGYDMLFIIRDQALADVEERIQQVLQQHNLWE